MPRTGATAGHRALRIAILGSCALGLASCAFPVGSPLAASDEGTRKLPAVAPTSSGEGHDVAAENARCERCHQDVAAEWRGSLHQMSWSDPVFGAAYGIEPLPFCRGCHAPEADPRDLPDEGARAVGVGCITCHAELARDAGLPADAGLSVDAAVLPASAGAMPPHPVRSTPRLATAAACAGCHEFDFPRRAGALMQGTLTEHRASKHADTACQTCHMKPASRAGGAVGKSHRFGVRSDPELLRSALSARAARRTERSILVTLRAAEVGHALPTGDMFRRLEVRAWSDDAQGTGAVRAPTVVLQRVFRLEGSGGGSSSRVEVRDERVAASGEPRDVVLVFPDSIAGRAIRWEIVYRRMGPTLAAAFGVDLEKDEVVIAGGTVDAAPRVGAAPRVDAAPRVEAASFSVSAPSLRPRVDSPPRIDSPPRLATLPPTPH